MTDPSSDPWLEAVPNFSEGRDENILQAIASAAKSQPAVHLLDYEADHDHHRSVFTLLGPASLLEKALFEMVRVATEKIDLSIHQGVHPRLGSADVIPFVPVGKSSRRDAVQSAKNLAQALGEQGLPTVLYGHAAQHSAYQDLAEVRKRFRQDPMPKPSCGPKERHPKSGVTVVGARSFLIAWNVNLASQDLEIAKNIARQIRERDGGLPGVKALAFRLEKIGCVQVSMNLVDYKRTNPGQVTQKIKELAQAEGLELAGTELIGFLPQEAAISSNQVWPDLFDLESDRILENHLPDEQSLMNEKPK